MKKIKWYGENITKLSTFSSLDEEFPEEITETEVDKLAGKELTNG